MISYRKLAMRVLGHPLRVPTNTPRPASHRVTALALTAAMVAGMAAPAYADTYYIGDGNITITKDTDGKTYVKHSNSTDKVKGDEDDGEIIIKGGKRSDDTTASGGSSSNGTASAASPAQPKLTTPPSEDIENEDKDMVYLGGTKGSDSSDGSGEENETDSTEKDQTGGKNTGAGSSDPESTGAGSSDPESTGSESGTSGSDDTIGSDGDGTKAGGTPTTGSGTPAEGAESTGSSSPAPESQFTYTGASLKVADDNDNSTQIVETAVQTFTTAAQNVIRIINKLVSNIAEDNTLNVTLDNVNIDVSSRQSTNAALSVEGVGDTKIMLEGKNTLTSGNQCAGLEHNGKDYYGNNNGKLTITSKKDEAGKDTGSLTATGGGGSAGIGSGWFGTYYGAGTIEITGGDIKATGGNNAAGIGSGSEATSDTHIIINGTAKVDAQATQNGAGIGSGHNSTGNTTIDIGGDAIVKAQGGSDAAGIGSGDDSTGTTTINIKGGTIKEAIGGDGGAGIGGGSGSKNITVNIEGGTIETAQGGQGHGSYDGGSGIHSDGDLTISGNAHIVNAIGGNGDSSNSRSDAGDGIRAGTLTISGEAHIDNATGGTADSGSAGDGIYSTGKLTIKDNAKIGTAKGGGATARDKDGGCGIRNHGQFTMSGGTITNAVGGTSTGRDGGDGIYCDDTLTIEGGEIKQTTGGEATGDGGYGIRSNVVLTIKGGKIEQTTGGEATGSHGIGGTGIGSNGKLTISGGEIQQATGGNATGTLGNGGSGIRGDSSNKIVEIWGGIITNAKGGDGKASGGYGIRSDGDLKIEGGTIGSLTTDDNGKQIPAPTTGALGGNAATGEQGGHGIYSKGQLFISDGANIINAKGGDATGEDSTGEDSTGGSGIRGDGSSDDFKLSIYSATITNATGGSGKWGGSGILGKTMEILTSTIQKAIGGRSTGEESYHTGGAGIAGSESLTIEGNTTVQATGGDADSGTGGSGIRSGSLSISGGTISAAGGSGKSGGAGIASSGTVSISNGEIQQAVGGRATGEDGTGGSGIHSNGTLTIRGGEIQQAVGGSATGTDGTGGSGIRSGSVVKIWGGTITKATGGSGKSGGDGIGSYGDLTISGSAKIETAQGGTSTDGNGGSGISSGSSSILTISGSANIGTAQGGASTNGTGGDGIHSGSVVKISGDTITKATGGNATGENSTGGSGIGGSFVNVEGGTINTTGGSGKSGGAGIDGDIVSISNTNTPLDITATSPDADKAIQSRDGKTPDKIIHLEENGKLGLVKLVENGITRLFHNRVYTGIILPGFSGSETHPLGEWHTEEPTCTEPGKKWRSCTVSGCVVTETEELPALGHQWSGWTPVEGGSREYRICAVCNAVEYRDVSHNSGFIIPTNLRVLDSTQTDILQNAQLVRLSQINDVLYIDVALETASLQGVLSDLTGLRSENIETVVFSTERCTSTLSLSDVAALGAGDTPFTLSHSGSTASFTVGGADHTALLR